MKGSKFFLELTPVEREAKMKLPDLLPLEISPAFSRASFEIPVFKKLEFTVYDKHSRIVISSFLKTILTQN